MKTIKTIFVAVFTLIGFTAMASEAGNVKVSMAADNSDLAEVEISSSVISHFEIDITDAYGENLYSMVTDAPLNSLKNKYDLSQLEDGTYFHTVKIDKETTMNQFEVKNGEFQIMESRKSIVPYFVFENDLLKLTYLNPHLEDVKLYVYDKSNQVVAEAELGNDLSIEKAIDFSNKPFGAYEVVISNDWEIYEFTVSID